MKSNLKEEFVMDKFAGGMIHYVEDYFASINGKIYRPTVDYSILDEEHIAEHWKELREELRSLKPVNEYSVLIKKVAAQYLPAFFDEYPELSGEECLKLNFSNC